MTGRFNWDWSDEGPPEEAYSRVTEPERFAPLHDWALDTVTRLERDYQVIRVEGVGLDHDLERSQISRPTVKLTPLHESGAPVTIAFTGFPGPAVRAGRWVIEYFPSCGCEFLRSSPVWCITSCPVGFENPCTCHPEATAGKPWSFVPTSTVVQEELGLPARRRLIS